MFNSVRMGKPELSCCVRCGWCACLSDPTDTMLKPQFHLSSFTSNFMCYVTQSSTGCYSSWFYFAQGILPRCYQQESGMVNNEYWVRTFRFQPLLLLLLLMHPYHSAQLRLMDCLFSHMDVSVLYFIILFVWMYFQTGLNMYGCRYGIFNHNTSLLPCSNAVLL